MVRPVCIQHTQLRDCGVALLPLEVCLRARHIFGCHRKPVFLYICRNLLFGELVEPVHRLHAFGHAYVHCQRIVRRKRSLARIHRVDNIPLDRIDIDIAFNRIHFGTADLGTVLARQQLDALRGAVRPLVILAGQVFHGKDMRLFSHIRHFIIIDRIGRALAHHLRGGRLKIFVADALHIVAIKHPDRGYGLAQVLRKILQRAPGLHVKPFPLLNKNPFYRHPSLLCVFCHIIVYTNAL